MILVADIAPQKLKNAATLTTAVVVPVHETIDPIQMDSMNCARNTMLLTIATSVPNPLTVASCFTSPSATTSN